MNSPDFTLQSFNTFDMSVGYSPTGSVTTLQPPSNVRFSNNAGTLRSSISPLGKVQLAFAAQEIIDLTETEDEEEPDEIIDLTNENDSEYDVQNDTVTPKKQVKFNNWVKHQFQNGGVEYEHKAGEDTYTVCTPYTPRKPVVSILAPLKQRRIKSKHEQSICYEHDAI